MGWAVGTVLVPISPNPHDSLRTYGMRSVESYELVGSGSSGVSDICGSR